MVFIFGIRIPDKSLVNKGICKIYGIGSSNSEKICKYFGLLKKTRVKDLNQKEWSNIFQYILLNKIKIEKDLKKELRLNLWNLLDIRNYRGMRHRIGLPVRGQRTHSNAQTQRTLFKSRIGKRSFSSFSLVSNIINSSTLKESEKLFFYNDKFKNLNYNNSQVASRDINLFSQKTQELSNKQQLYTSTTLKTFDPLISKNNKDLLNLIFFVSAESTLRLKNTYKMYILFAYNFSVLKKRYHLVGLNANKIKVPTLIKNFIKFKVKKTLKKKITVLSYSTNSILNFFCSFSLRLVVPKYSGTFKTYKLITRTNVLTVYSKYSNIFIYFTNWRGDLLKYVSGGSVGLSGKQKGSPYAGRIAMDAMFKFLRANKFKRFIFIRKGIGPAKKAAIRHFRKYKKFFKIILRENSTIVPHNGCRLKKVKR